MIVGKLRVFLKLGSFFFTSFRRNRAGFSILMYHRVIDNGVYEVELSKLIFEKQMQSLIDSYNIISIEDVNTFFKDCESFKKKSVVITFDDAFDDFYKKVFPVIKRLNIPVTLYVPTGFIEDPNLVPISKKYVAGSNYAPMTWEMLRDVAESKLVTIGSHTHSHYELITLSDSQILNELNICDSLLEKKLNIKVKHFAYPRGIFNSRVENLVKDKYESIVLAGGGGINSSNFFSYRIPRIPVLRSDGMFWFKARIEGRLIYEEIAVKTIKKFIRRFMK